MQDGDEDGEDDDEHAAGGERLAKKDCLALWGVLRPVGVRI